MFYTYHYHIMWQLEPSEMNHADGLMRLEEKIHTAESYKALRESLASRNNIDPKKLIICSLTLIDERTLRV